MANASFRRHTRLVATNVPEHYVVETIAPIGELLRGCADPAAAVRQGAHVNVAQDARLLAQTDDFILRHIEADRSRLPVPRDREMYGGEDHVRYWAMGLGDALLNNELIATYLGLGPDAPITTLDLGCASGRVIRHQHLLRPGSRVMGCDINPNNIAFARSYLAPEVFAFHNVSFPPLPLADASVDFVAALSVFTHIDDFEDAWLLEISRILRPGGLAFVTVHTERTLADMKPGHFIRCYLEKNHSVTGKGVFHPEPSDASFSTDLLADRLVFTNKDWPGHNTNVFHHTDFIRRRWGQFLTIEQIVPEAHGGHQEGIVLRK